MRILPLSLYEFFSQLLHSPTLTVTVLLILSVLLVNGWTDAPNAIACAVVTGSLSFRTGVLLAAVCNLLGVLWSCLCAPAVSYTIYSLVQFSGSPQDTLYALCAAMGAIVLWAAAAWWFGIPTSESHALVAALSGSAAALENTFSCIRWESWSKVLLGLLLSVGLGFLIGCFCSCLLRPLPLHDRLCKSLQIPGAALSAFLHGAQDGQKFLGIFLLGCALSAGRQDEHTFPIPVWLMILCAVFMALGTGLGGRRIIDKVGREMVTLSPKDGVACDLASGVCLFLSTLSGIPVSTTHTRTASLLGVGRAGTGSCNFRVVRTVLAAWLLTFPCCFLLGGALCRLTLLRM